VGGGLRPRSLVRPGFAHTLEETFQDFILRVFKKNRTVYVDDLHLLNSVVCCSSFYPRKDVP
jgi:hypothetical protein